MASIEVLKTEIKNIMDIFQEMRKDNKDEHNELRKELKSWNEMITNFIISANKSFATKEELEKGLKKKAPKRTEKAITWTVASVIGVIITMILTKSLW